MQVISEGVMFLRFAGALRGFLKRRLTLAEAEAILRQRLAQREENFLRTAERVIYGQARSPYRALLRHAGCQAGDLRALVRARGLEGALRCLREQGVYVTLEEFKGRAPIRRGALELRPAPRDFDNLWLPAHFYGETGGSSGQGQRVPNALETIADFAPHLLLLHAAAGLLDAPYVLWRGILPDTSAVDKILATAWYDRLPDKWYSPHKPFSHKDPKYTLATYYFVAAARFFGARVPWPEYLPVERAGVVARWAAEAARRRGRSAVMATVSRALRVAQAAAAEGLDLQGVTFIVGSEPLTPEKERGILASGARIILTYATTEAGLIAHGCARPLDGTDLHLAQDGLALIACAPDDAEAGAAFHLTTLLPSAPKVMLNVELDDYGIVEERDCGCPRGQLGFTTHLRGIHSARKLTVEGVTLLADEVGRILERDLPARFGGTPLDYQLVEEQDECGLTRLYLHVSPRVPLADEQAAAQAVLRGLRAASAAADVARDIWAQAGTLQVRRQEPLLTPRGKFLPLHVQRGFQAARSRREEPGA